MENMYNDTDYKDIYMDGYLACEMEYMNSIEGKNIMDFIMILNDIFKGNNNLLKLQAISFLSDFVENIKNAQGGDVDIKILFTQLEVDLNTLYLTDYKSDTIKIKDYDNKNKV